MPFEGSRTCNCRRFRAPGVPAGVPGWISPTTRRLLFASINPAIPGRAKIGLAPFRAVDPAQLPRAQHTQLSPSKRSPPPCPRRPSCGPACCRRCPRSWAHSPDSAPAALTSAGRGHPGRLRTDPCLVQTRSSGRRSPRDHELLRSDRRRSGDDQDRRGQRNFVFSTTESQSYQPS